jgi:hypothetical protein
MGISGGQVMKISGPKEDIDELEFYFKAHHVQEEGGRSTIEAEFGSLFFAYSAYISVFSSNPKALFECKPIQQLSDIYDKLIETNAGKIFKERINVSYNSGKLSLQDRLELNRHTLLFKDIRRESPNQIVVGHYFRNRPTISFVKCLARLSPRCFFVNYCEDEDGLGEICVFQHGRYSLNKWVHCYCDEHSWAPVGAVERYGIRSLVHDASMKLTKDDLQNKLRDISKMNSDNCGCISLGHSTCLIMDPSRVYDICMRVGDYYDEEEYKLDDYQTAMVEKMARDYEKTISDICVFFKSKGATVCMPDCEISIDAVYRSIPEYPEGVRYCLTRTKVKEQIRKRNWKNMYIKCRLKGFHPIKLISLLCKKYKASFWCSFEDTTEIITGGISINSMYHYPRVKFDI